MGFRSFAGRKQKSMKWNKFTIRTRTEAEDIIVATLAEIGIQGAEIQDKQPLSEADKQSMFVAMMKIRNVF